MTANRSGKQAARTRAKRTGEPYTLAKRRALPPVMAWDDEDERIVIYGTHDPVKARDEFIRYYTEDCGFKPGDDWWSDELTDPAFYAAMQHLWTAPKDDEEPFDMRNQPGPGLVPFLLGSHAIYNMFNGDSAAS